MPIPQLLYTTGKRAKALPKPFPALILEPRDCNHQDILEAYLLHSKNKALVQKQFWWRQVEVLGGNYKQQRWGPGRSGRSPKHSSKAQRMVGVRFLLPRQPLKFFSPSIRWIFVLWVHINNATNCFSRRSYWKKLLHLHSYMPTHELKDLGFVFPVTSEDITKGSK